MVDEERILAGRYRIGSVIGRGGMAVVYKGRDTKLGRNVAVKILKSELASDPAFRTRFRQEAQSASRMSHSGIVRVFDAGEESVRRDNGELEREPFIVMEYVQGHQLKDLIAQGPLEVDEAVSITQDILTALEYSHRAGVVHRDIKPGNIMITPEGTVKVMDFGIARAVSDTSSTVAQTTQILGTASYFSPEQAKGETVDARTDIYSASVVLFEMLTGRAPFVGDTAVSVAYQHVSETPVKPSSLNSAVTAAIDKVVLTGLAKDRYQRYQTASDFSEALSMAADGHIPLDTVAMAHDDDVATELFGAAPPPVNDTEQALRQLTNDDTVTRTQRRPPVVWIWAGVTVVAVIMLAVLWWVMTLPQAAQVPSASRTIPSLTGTTWDSAEKTLTDLDLLPTKYEEASADVPAGEVISLDPEAGTRVAPNTQVKVYISTGADLNTIPDVANMTLDEAQATIEDAGLEVGSISSENSASVPKDTVLSTSPAVGEDVPEGTTIDIVISDGMVTIPDMSGKALETARQELEGEKYALTVIEVTDDSCVAQEGNPVTSQSIGPGEVPQHSTIELTYCTGAPDDGGGDDGEGGQGNKGGQGNQGGQGTPDTQSVAVREHD
ncbi:Stk1 family PASTA domain-containing Ser/Thr kinase [Paramicrobacterium chengjingii]|uniref:non-specific serine/threonine protein kinase n=1 Tax=Paramicrobacterium chengjingii TaxID=2769067 RepID=A0ABX6YJK3_9MICO|nr:Stk1 family PASTA domain-containing Ser/Thr kinase [Microbacterium chengjingii]QPZ38581.1 Stk1 family PASTA domain-containing Ser/Thr kinase [Microbacterium chengjingii]